MDNVDRSTTGSKQSLSGDAISSTEQLIPAYDFSPVGEGVTFLPKGNREGSCARSRLHDSTDLECRGPVS